MACFWTHRGGRHDGPPDFRIACCLCGKPIPRAPDIYALDEEWQRRYPKMIGILACSSCAVSRNIWSCRGPGGKYVAGHHPAASQGDCDDSWDHIDGFGTHAAMVCSRPFSALQQGAEEYLRHMLGRPRVNSNVAGAIRDAFDRRDALSVNRGRPR